MSAEAASIDIKNTTAIVVDDDDIMRTILSGMLRSLGIKILGELNDGESAWTAFQQLSPQLVCLDIHMPGITGLDVLSRIRQASATTGILMISASPTAGNVRKALELGANGFIAKPFSAAKIGIEIARALAVRPVSAQKSNDDSAKV